MAFLTQLLDALFPPACRLCGAPAADGVACPAHTLPRCPAGERCRRCGTRLPAGFPDGASCAACLRDPPPFARLVSLGDYREEAALRQWVLALKHGGRVDLAEPLGAALAARLLDVAGPQEGTWLVPVPLHPLRRLERGYDQAAKLARAAGRRLGMPAREVLLRRRPTAVQGAPGSPSRRSNVRGAFALDADALGPLSGRGVWLVDDVVTSGATAQEGARVLKRAGAARVAVLCLACATG